MKEPIEELFKQSLKGHEMPYNANAWKAMSARLDVVSPIATPTSYLKYYIGAAVIGVAAVTTYVLLSSGNSTEINTVQVAKEDHKNNSTIQTTKPTSKTNESESNNSSSNSNPLETNSNSSTDKTMETVSLIKSNSDINTQGSSVVVQSNEGVTLIEKTKGHRVLLPDPNESSSSTAATQMNTETRQKMTMPAIADLCLNEEVAITNPNAKEIYILDGLNNTIITIPAKKAVNFKPTQVGNYALGYKKDSKLETASNFQVSRIPDADFMIDVVNKFDNGLPATHVEAISGQGTYIWKAKKQSSTGLEADMHFYKKGNQSIELTVNDGQCSATLEKTIYLENDYNLMAVNSFTPTSLDPKNTTFMPFALTQRDVNFTLTIIDGRNGGLVYETSDATLPWDGTDIRIGRRETSPQVYVWKVVITNPAANEPGEYLGTITMN